MANRDADVVRQAAQQEPSIKWLTRLVIGLGLVLVGGIILLFVLLATGAHLKDKPVSAVATPSGNEFRNTLLLPKNSRVMDVLSTGNRVVVRIRLADGTEQLMALDGASLKLLGMTTMQVEK